jgi:hypothetical protein
MSYIIDAWYVMYPDGSLVPCQNLSTAKYLVDIGDAVKVVDITRELMKA